MSVNVPSELKHSTQPLTSTFSARSYALRMICSLFTGKSFLFGLSKLRLAPGHSASALPQVDGRFLQRQLDSLWPDKRWRVQDLLAARRPFQDAGRDHCSARNIANCRNIGQLSYG